MARMSARRLGEFSPAVRCVPAGARRADRMARFAAGARRVMVRALVAGGLVAVGWLLAVAFQMMFTAAPAAAESTAATGSGTQHMDTPLTGAPLPGASPSDAPLPIRVSDDAEAMAGLTVDGLTSESDHGLPSPGPTGQFLDTDGLVPTGGAGGPFGPSMGDDARDGFDPRLDVRRVPPAYVHAPVVRAAADDPSFSPD